MCLPMLLDSWIARNPKSSRRSSPDNISLPRSNRDYVRHPPAAQSLGAVRIIMAPIHTIHNSSICVFHLSFGGIVIVYRPPASNSHNIQAASPTASQTPLAAHFENIHHYAPSCY
ncbi:hypothetical protein JTB14_034103 [Gonioctena quinquepunctata]|nr:hypothetical protein JTB14_034103 [Gonioctena quinquepunctata]